MRSEEKKKSEEWRKRMEYMDEAAKDDALRGLNMMGRYV
jgi:hypothetical protein